LTGLATHDEGNNLTEGKTSRELFSREKNKVLNERAAEGFTNGKKGGTGRV